MFAPGAIASETTASFCSTLKRRRRSTRPSSSAVAYDIDLALLLAPLPSQHPASSSRRSQGGRHRRDTLLPQGVPEPLHVFGSLPMPSGGGSSILDCDAGKRGCSATSEHHLIRKSS